MEQGLNTVPTSDRPSLNSCSITMVGISDTLNKGRNFFLVEERPPSTVIKIPNKHLKQVCNNKKSIFLEILEIVVK